MCSVNIIGCTGKKEGINEKKEAVSKIQIGVTYDSKVLERWVRDIDVFVSTAERMGAQVDVQSANSDLATQIDQIDYFTQQGKDVIVIVAVDCDKLVKAVTRAREKGVKVISYDRLINGVQTDLFVSFDNEKVGELMADTMIQALPAGGKIMMISGPKSDSNAVIIENTFKKRIAGTGLEIVQIEHAKGWTAEYAFETVDAAFENISDIDGVMCGNDGLAVQAINALAERRLAGNVVVVGQDADVEACQKIVEGMQTMTVYKPIESLAKKAAEYAVMLAQNLPLSNVNEEVVTGNYTVRANLITPIAVTKDNMDKVIIDSGFHLREDVYRNVIE